MIPRFMRIPLFIVRIAVLVLRPNQIRRLHLVLVAVHAGELLGESEVSLFVVNLLGMCDIVPAKGPDGRDIVVKPEYVGQSTVYTRNDCQFGTLY
jgi:hypothetical protein